MLSILNSQTKDTDQAKAESIFSILPLGASVLTRFSNLNPIRKSIANAQEEQATAQLGLWASIGVAIGAALVGAGAGEGFSRILLEEQVRTEDIDLAELISLIGNDQAIQQEAAKTQQFSDIISTLRNTAADAIPELTERAVTFLVERVSDYLENLIRGTGGEQAKMEGGLTREQLEELLEMSPFIKE